LGNLREKCKRRLWKWTSLSIGSPSGEPGVGLVLPGTLRDRLEGSGIGMSLYGSSVRELGGRAPSMGTLKATLRHVKEGFGNEASLTLYRFCEGNLEGRPLFWGL